LLQISGLFAPLQIVRNLHSAEICKSAWCTPPHNK
jgi:hypothetical protein